MAVVCVRVLYGLALGLCFCCCVHVEPSLSGQIEPDHIAASELTAAVKLARVYSTLRCVPSAAPCIPSML